MQNTNSATHFNNKISDLEIIISNHKCAIDNISQQRDSLVLENKYILEEKEYLEQRIKLLTSALYGKKSEGLKSSELEDVKQQILPNLFNEAEVVLDQPNSDQPDSDNEDDDIEIKTKPKSPKKTGRKKLSPNLPRKEIIHDLTEEQKICHCGCSMNKIGEEASEELEHIPSTLRVLKHIRYRYACRKCHENVQIAKAPLKIIDKGICSASVIAHSLVSKFEDHLPFYRQSQMFKRQDIDLSDRTMCNNALKASNLFEPLTSLLKEDLLSSNYICSDETTLNVLLDPTATNYMWIHHTGARDKRAVIFEYTSNRSGSNPHSFLKTFKGIHQCDGYSGYNGLYKKGDVLRQGCMDHARRKFMDVYKLSGKKAGLSKDILKLIKKLYKLESTAKDDNLTLNEIKQIRQEHSKPLLNNIKDILLANKDKIPEKSSLGKAVYYMLTQWNALTLYLEYPHIRISNADAERIIKPFVIGRKNWLFNKTTSGAKASATIYSIIETCKANNINSYKYMCYILPKLKEIEIEYKKNPDLMTNERRKELLKALLPYNINPNNL